MSDCEHDKKGFTKSIWFKLLILAIIVIIAAVAWYASWRKPNVPLDVQIEYEQRKQDGFDKVDPADYFK